MHYIAYDPVFFINGRGAWQNLILRIGIYVGLILAMKV